MANFSTLGMRPHLLHTHAVFLWCEGILPEFSQTCPKKTPKKLFMSIQAPLFSNQSMLAPFLLIFSGVCEGSQRFFPGFIGIGPDFMGFCPDFHQIKIFGVWLHASYTSDEE